MAPPVVRRLLHDVASRAAGRFPVVTITGPRQAGKTTLARAAFADKPYANLEEPDVRDFARSDPRGFLGQFADGAILDEIQRSPELLSYIQTRVDDRRRRGEFVLTGSQHLGLLQGISQSLAGRTAILNLLPLGIEELRRFPSPPAELFDTMIAGGYPRIHDQGIPAAEWLANYTATYVERDVRQVLNVGDLTAFQTFLRLSAGRVAQLLNLSGLGADCGISHNTAKAWLSVLEAGFIVFRLPPLHRNLGKRLTKSPKLFFYDTGLLCYLLGIRSAAELELHPLRGPIFECWVVSEIVKARAHRGLAPDLHFYRDQKGLEIDVVVEAGPRLLAVEIKSGQTVASDFLEPLVTFAGRVKESRQAPRHVENVLVYGGEALQRRTEAAIVPWSRIDAVDWLEARAPRR
jgi:predicted AAA+ superfamily ATPase